MKNAALSLVALVCFVGTSSGCFAAGPDATSGWVVQPAKSLAIPRAAHHTTAISPRLVLVTGGCSGHECSPVERSAELLDAASGTSEATRPMTEARVAHAAARLGDGRVLIAGGWTGTATTASAEVFNPERRSFSPVQAMATARMDATATPLPDGGILIAGGATVTNRPVADAEIFDQARNLFVRAGAMHEARAHHAAVRLQDGRVLIIGGQRGRNIATNSAEIYDPGTRSFSRTGAMQVPRCKHSAVLLADGRVMVIAGSSDCDERRRTARTEIYDPATGRFTAGPSLLNPRYKIIDATTVLPTGEVVVAGDASDVEIWSPGTTTFVRASQHIGDRLAFSTATPLPDGSVLVLGGYDDDIRPTSQAWLVERGKSPRVPD